MKDATFESTLARIMSAIGSTKLKDLALALSITEQAVSKAIKKKKIPKNWLYKISTKNNLSLEWLIYGSDTEPDDLVQNTTPVYPNGCAQCVVLYEKLEKANERLYQAGEEIKLLLRENSELRTKLTRLEAH